MDERLFKLMKRHLKYDADEFELFKERPENRDILERIRDVTRIEIVAEVVSAKGCNSKHFVGQKIYFDGAGNLNAAKSPDRICIFLLGNLPGLVFSIHELLYAGIELNDLRLRFPRTGCSDVGVENCGWGHVIAEVSVHEFTEESA